MQNSISLTKHLETSIQIENAAVRLLIHRRKNIEPDEESMLNRSMHSHVSAELFAVAEGSITLDIPGEKITLNKGDAALVPPGIQHYKSSASSDAQDHIVSVLCYKRNSGEEYDLYKLISPMLTGENILVFRSKPEIYNAMDKLITVFSINKFLSAMHMVELLIKIADIKCERVAPALNLRTNESCDADIERMMKLDELINGFFTHELTLDEAAKHLYISARQLDRIVRKRYGKSLRCVVVDKRISVAEKMLTTTDMTVDKIGRAVGFGSKMGFYREFSKRFFATPAEYRNKMKTKK